MKCRFFLLLTVCMVLASTALAEDGLPPLRLGGGVAMTDYWADNNIPTSRPDYGWDDYLTIARGGNAPDLYLLDSRSNDFLAAKNAGLLADISGSEAVRAWTDRLRPDIKRLVTTEDGGIVGLAWFASLSPVYWQQDAWDAAGLTSAEVPQSYEELLDFLEKWPQRESAKSICAARPKNDYVNWLLELLINTWELQAYHAGEALNFDTPEFAALLERTRDVGERLNKAEPGAKRNQSALALFEDDSSKRYNGGRNYGLSHALPFRVTAAQPELTRGVALIYAVRADSPWQNEILGEMAYELTEGALKEGRNADLLADVRLDDPSVVTAGYLADMESYAGAICFAPMRTVTQYEKAIQSFAAGRLSAQALAAQISVYKTNPNE